MIINDALKAVQPTIEGLGWVEHYGGVAFPFTRDEGGAEVNGRYVPNMKTYPVSDTLTNEDCLRGKYKNLMPNSQYKNLLYWEVTSEGRFANNLPATPAKGFSVQGRARLVYFMNLAKHGIGKDYDTQVGLVGVTLGNALSQQYSVFDGAALVLGKPTFEQMDAARIFPYDYGKAIEAFKLYPYAYGAVSFEVTIHLTPDCLPDLTVGVPLECVTKW